MVRHLPDTLIVYFLLFKYLTELLVVLSPEADRANFCTFLNEMQMVFNSFLIIIIVIIL